MGEGEERGRDREERNEFILRERREVFSQMESEALPGAKRQAISKNSKTVVLEQLWVYKAPCAPESKASRRPDAQ